MGRLVSVDFRGESVDVEIDHDGGCEPDTNVHEIEWHFFGLTAEQHDALNITAEEEQRIYDTLASLDPMTFDDDVI